MVIWLTGIVALALMLIILAIAPSQLAMIVNTSSVYWQWITYLLLSIAVICGLAGHRAEYSACQSKAEPTDTQAQHCNFSLSLKLAVPELVTQYLTPIFVLKQQGLLAVIAKVLAILFFLLAIICNTLAQRVASLQAAPLQPIYIEALVTPDGLSDKRLTFHSDTNSLQGTSKQREVTQGYRQLVTLTRLKPYDKTELGAGSHGAARLTDNPFSSQYSLESSASNPHTPVNSEPNLSDTKVSEAADGYTLPDQMTVMLYVYQANNKWINQLAPNQQVRMRLTLRPLENKDTANGFNEYRWLSTRHATAIAEIIEAKPQHVVKLDRLSLWQRINTYRYQLREHFMQSKLYSTSQVDTLSANYSNKQDAAAVTLSLLTGDRSLISTEMTDLYRFAGISHLLAISGAHVLFLAILFAGLVSMIVTRLCPRVYRVLPRWQLRFVIAVIVAFAYAIFAGFDVPAVRTAWMLIIVGLVRYLLATTSIFKVLLVLAIAMAWQDSFVLWQAGYWLSFVAVTVLIVYSQRWSMQANSQAAPLAVAHLNDKSVDTVWVRIRKTGVDFLKLQLWMSVALLPISLWLFGKVSLWGFIVNIFAIGWFGWIIVPLNLLAGLVYTVSSKAADCIWSFIVLILQAFHELLTTLQTSASQVGWLHADMTLSMVLLLLLIVLPWMLPKGMLSRYLSLPSIVVIAASAFGWIDSTQTVTRITTIETSNPNVYAVLVSSKQHHWLLLSGYQYRSKSMSMDLTPQQAESLAQVLYDRLQGYDVDMLTGIVVQTNRPKMAMVVANLRKNMPILNYWQAGLKANQTKISSYTQGTGLSAQACISNKSWQSAYSALSNSPEYPLLNDDKQPDKKIKGSELVVQAVTGWQDIHDATVQDCAINVRSRDVVELSSMKSDSMDTLMPLQSLQTNHGDKLSPATNVLIYSSAQSKLAKLWQLLCAADTIQTRTVATAQVDDIGPMQQHWLVSPQTIIDTALLDTMQPLSLHISQTETAKPSQDLKEVGLYWQQRFNSQNEYN